jgi:hypothetical protein
MITVNQWHSSDCLDCRLARTQLRDALRSPERSYAAWFQDHLVFNAAVPVRPSLRDQFYGVGPREAISGFLRRSQPYKELILGYPALR